MTDFITIGLQLELLTPDIADRIERAVAAATAPTYSYAALQSGVCLSAVLCVLDSLEERDRLRERMGIASALNEQASASALRLGMLDAFHTRHD